MAKIDQDFTIYQGEDIEMTIAVTDEAGAVLNMTGATPEWKATDLFNTVILTKTPTLVDVDGTNDGLQFTIDEADTVALNPQTYHHEAEIIDASSNRSVVTEGQLTLKYSRTK